MLILAINLAYAGFGLALLLCLGRLLVGPHLADRLLALDTAMTNAIGVLLVIGIDFASTHYFEIALLLAMLGFIGSLALCRFVLRGEVIE